MHQIANQNIPNILNKCPTGWKKICKADRLKKCLGSQQRYDSPHTSDFTPQVKQARNQHNTTYRQSLHLQAVHTVETMKGWNKVRKSKQPQDCCEKLHNTNQYHYQYQFIWEQL